MAATLTGNVLDITGETITDPGRAVVYVDFANVRNGVYVDASNDALRVGRKKADLASDGSFSVEDLIDDADLFYTLTVRYRVGAEERSFKSGAFTLPSGTSGVGDLVYTDLSTVSPTVLAQAIAAAERAEVAAAAASGLVPDPNDPGFYLRGSTVTPDPADPGLYLIGA